MEKSIRLKKPKKKEVVWLDAHSPPATQVFNISDDAEMDAVHGPAVITTVGWILRDDDKGITIANEYCGDGDYRGVTFILRINIVDVLPLTTGRSKKSEKAKDAATPKSEQPKPS